MTKSERSAATDHQPSGNAYYTDAWFGTCKLNTLARFSHRINLKRVINTLSANTRLTRDSATLHCLPYQDFQAEIDYTRLRHLGSRIMRYGTRH